jgi:hypothetical protein
VKERSIRREGRCHYCLKDRNIIDGQRGTGRRTGKYIVEAINPKRTITTPKTQGGWPGKRGEKSSNSQGFPGYAEKEEGSYAARAEGRQGRRGRLLGKGSSITDPAYGSE